MTVVMMVMAVVRTHTNTLLRWFFRFNWFAWFVWSD